MVKRNPTHTQSIATRATLSPNPTPYEKLEDLLPYDNCENQQAPLRMPSPSARLPRFNMEPGQIEGENELDGAPQTLVTIKLDHHSGFSIHATILRPPTTDLSKIALEDLRIALQAMCIQFASESMQESLISILDSDVQVTFG